MIYDVSYKSFIVAKPFSIMFDKVDRFIKDCGGTKYLVLQGSETFDAIFERIRYLIGLKVVFHMFMKVVSSHNY